MELIYRHLLTYMKGSKVLSYAAQSSLMTVLVAELPSHPAVLW